MKYYFECPGRHGLYPVSSGTFQRFLTEEKYEEVEEKLQDNEQSVAVLEFDKKCPKCTSFRVNEKVKIKIRTLKDSL